MAASITDTQSYHAKVVGTEVATLEEVSAGTSLQVKPRIVEATEPGKPCQMWMTVSLADGGFEAVSVDAMPMKRTTSLQTQTAVYENDSVMLAGYFREIDEKAGWGIPILRDIPLIGWLFGGSSTHKETVQRMFIITPHIVELDVDRLVRAQSARLGDTTAGEEAIEGAEDGDEANERRRLEREDNRQRRREKAEDELARRKAELEHGRRMRQIERAREQDFLSEDVRDWQAEEEAAREKLNEEIKDRAAAEEARRAAAEAAKNPPPKVRKVIEDDETATN